MKDTIYLIVSESGVLAMRKTLPDVRRGEVPLKLSIEVPKEAFQPPVIAKEVYVEDWRQGIDLEDVEFRQNIITQEEAAEIRQRRLQKMEEVLKRQGYKVEKPKVK